ncbi:MAG: hypothetical protein ACRC6M_05815 [Microcystaceae cyanobacterium]
MGGIIGFVLGVIYVAGIWRFWSGYRRTNFSPSLSSRIYLALLWPVLIIVNGNYRKNFQKALKSS